MNVAFGISDKGMELSPFGILIREVRHNALACLTRLQRSLDLNGSPATEILIDRVIDYMDIHNISL